MELATIGNNTDTLELNPIIVNEDYCKKWNITGNDFLCLSKNGQILRNTLYRKGGFNSTKVTDDYFILIKYVEDYYSKEIMKMSKSKDSKHLDGRWCILDKFGNEKIVFEKSLDYPYLVNNSCIYHINGKYCNIETGYLYCSTSKSMESSDYLFLENRFDNDKSKRGVMKINKKTGTYELYSLNYGI